MKQQLQTRLDELKQEFASGQQVLADLQTKQTEVQNTMLRLQGAIQVLEEELAKAESSTDETEVPDEDVESPVAISTNAHG